MFVDSSNLCLLLAQLPKSIFSSIDSDSLILALKEHFKEHPRTAYYHYIRNPNNGKTDVIISFKPGENGSAICTIMILDEDSRTKFGVGVELPKKTI